MINKELFEKIAKELNESKIDKDGFVLIPTLEGFDVYTVPVKKLTLLVKIASNLNNDLFTI